MRISIPTVLSFVLMATSVGAHAAEPGKASERDRAVRVQVTLSQERSDKRPTAPSRVYQFVVLDNGEPGKLTIGSRVAIPITTVGSKSDDLPVTSFTYQNVGAIIDCAVERVGTGLFEVRFKFEDSWMDPGIVGRTGQAPIETTALELNTVIASGKPQVLGRLAQADGSARLVELLIEPM